LKREKTQSEPVRWDADQGGGEKRKKKKKKNLCTGIGKYSIGREAESSERLPGKKKIIVFSERDHPRKGEVLT